MRQFTDKFQRDIFLEGSVSGDRKIELIKTQQEYIDLLIAEINDLCGMASVHGWRSTRVDEGKRLREKIITLKNIPYPI